MRYLGGKSKGRLAIDIAAIVNAARVRIGGAAGPAPFWDPFCGGLGVARRLVATGPGIVSDAHPALISLYRAIRAGWDPPEALTREEYAAARGLPDTDPRKAFAGFGCSFGGKWFGGFGSRTGQTQRSGNPRRPLAICARESLIADRPWLRACAVATLDFLEIAPRPLPLVIYADPPYAGTEPYSAVAPFDSARFWGRIQAWERAGVPCFVSEYTCPVTHRIELEATKPAQLDPCFGVGGRKDRALERLFRVLP